MLDYRMETFLKLCEIKNYTRTAELLNITQPAVSQHIKFLEEYYGKKLFIYSGKNLELTDAGMYLKSNIMTMQVNSNKLRRQLFEQSLGRKEIKFGATLSIGEYYMPEIIKNLIYNYPKYSFSMIVENTQTLLNKLERGEIEFALLEGIFNKQKYETRLISNEKFICVSGERIGELNHKISMNDILNYRLILRENGSGTREILEQLLIEKNITIDDFNNKLELGNINLIKYMVEQNMGITFLYKIAVLKELEMQTLFEVNIQDFEPKREFNFVFLKNSIFMDEYLELYDIINRD